MCYWHSWNFCRTDRSSVSVSLPTWNAYKKSLLFYSVPNPFLPLLGVPYAMKLLLHLVDHGQRSFFVVFFFLSSPIYKAVFYVNYFILIAWKMMLILRLARRSQQVNSKCSSVFAEHSGWTTSTMISSELMFVHWNSIKFFIKNAREKWAVLPVIFITRNISVQVKIRLNPEFASFPEAIPDASASLFQTFSYQFLCFHLLN